MNIALATHKPKSKLKSLSISLKQLMQFKLEKWTVTKRNERKNKAAEPGVRGGEKWKRNLQ